MEKYINIKNLKEEFFDPSKYNRNVSDVLKTELEYPIKYFIKDIKINDDIIKKYFVIDIRNLNDDKVKYIFNNFEEIQRVIFSNYFYRKENDTFKLNMELIFLINKEENYQINKYTYLYDMEYSLKSFMNYEELINLLNKEYTFKNISREKLIDIKDKILKLNHFNYIEGDNGSGKTRLLKFLSNQLCVPIFSMDNIDFNLENEIQDIDSVKSIIYDLTGEYEIDKYSNYGNYIKRLSQIIQFSKEHNNILLLDDLRWYGLDSRNRLKLINALADYSYEHNPVVITGCDQNELIKRKVYKSNIILAKDYLERV